jgi:hypothetical protein
MLTSRRSDPLTTHARELIKSRRVQRGWPWAGVAAGRGPARVRMMKAHKWRLVVAALAALAFFGLATAPGAHAGTPLNEPSITGTVKDSLGRALGGAQIELEARGGARVAGTRSDSTGAFSFAQVPPGTYAVVARVPDFKPAVAIATVAAHRTAHVTLAMESEAPLSLKLSAPRLRPARNAVAPGGATAYRFSEQAIRDLPLGENGTINQVLIQAPGMIQDSTGQPLPREMDDSLQYRINGVMIPNVQVLDLGQLSPRFAQSIDVLTGSLPAQYGYRTGAVVDIHTRSGAIANGGSLEYFGGQRETTEPSFEYGGSQGSLSYFATGYFLHDIRGVNPPTPGPDPLNDFTNQGASFLYLSDLINADTSLSLIGASFVHNFGWPATPGQAQVFQLSGVPVYPSTQVSDTELEQTHFGILALKGVTAAGVDYQVSLFSQYSSLSFRPDFVGELIYDGLAARVFRSSFVNGSQADATWRLGASHTLGFGYYFDIENAEIDDHAYTFPAAGGVQTSALPFLIVDNHNLMQAMYGLYVQDRWQPLPELTINCGLRWDQLLGFIRGSQVSPRLGASYELDPATTLHAGAAVYFVPPPTEFLATEDIDRFVNTTAEPSILQNSPPKPMADYFFDLGIRHSFPFHLQLGVDGFFELERDVLDEGQFGSSLIFAPINYRLGRVYGAEATASYELPGSLSAYLNFAYTVAQASQVVSGQFNFDPAEFAYIANHYIALDQGQLFTTSAGFAYRWHGFVATTAITFGSGLRTGFANTAMMPPYTQVDASLGRSFSGVPWLGRIDTRLSIVNLFDRIYQFHNGSGIGVGNVPQYMPRRALYFDLKVPLPPGNKAGGPI